MTNPDLSYQPNPEALIYALIRGADFDRMAKEAKRLEQGDLIQRLKDRRDAYETINNTESFWGRIVHRSFYKKREEIIAAIPGVVESIKRDGITLENWEAAKRCYACDAPENDLPFLRIRWDLGLSRNNKNAIKEMIDVMKKFMPLLEESEIDVTFLLTPKGVENLRKIKGCKDDGSVEEELDIIDFLARTDLKAAAAISNGKHKFLTPFTDDHCPPRADIINPLSPSIPEDMKSAKIGDDKNRGHREAQINFLKNIEKRNKQSMLQSLTDKDWAIFRHVLKNFMQEAQRDPEEACEILIKSINNFVTGYGLEALSEAECAEFKRTVLSPKKLKGYMEEYVDYGLSPMSMIMDIKLLLHRRYSPRQR